MSKGGTQRVVLVHIKRVSIKRGTILYVCRDITERKQAEYTLRRNEERLKLALEAADERRRLARELHDGVSQRLALLSVELGLLRELLRESSPALEHVDRVLGHTDEVSAELHRVSHELHPALLEHLGLADSIRRVCCELSRRARQFVWEATKGTSCSTSRTMGGGSIHLLNASWTA
jgi:signal transduction histidine kinase